MNKISYQTCMQTYKVKTQQPFYNVNVKMLFDDNIVG